MSSIYKNILPDGQTVTSVCLWILISSTFFASRVSSMSTNDRSDEPPPLSAVHVSHTKSALDSAQDPERPSMPSQAYLIDPSYIQLPAVSRLLNRYRDTKRSWQNLQSSWGKRAGYADPNQLDENGDGLSNDDYSDMLMLLSKSYGSDAAERALGDENGDLSDDDIILAAQKRAWNKMNASWGKRVAAARNNNGNGKSKLEPTI